MDDQSKPATDELAKTKKSLTISRWSNIATALFRLLDCKHQSIKQVDEDLWCLRCGSPLRRVDGQLEITV